jgi:hypothetical protein
MAHVDTVYEGKSGRWAVDEHVCAESLNDDWCRDECRERSHTYYVVTEIDTEGYGSIVADSFATADDAIRWAQDYFKESE